ncbi:tail fiber assembly protein [Salmonella enterica]|nr:phage tail protein [Salmonella enterica]EBP4191126.1 tail fiber assembly protein [Salmonella enterica subsp. enterica]EDV2860791.1 tail fiber assembly protein [Salmonella enterica subsp. houtenae]HAE8324851.1 tail fiber assembly protein [Salmonella enterica subsp. houtenae serovar 50:g,z51:-]EBL8806015.1 phage tail protein [Salmonella enterica]
MTTTKRQKTSFATVSEKIASLQDAVYPGIATDDEKAQFDEWKKYRLVVNRVDTLNPDWLE